MKKMLLIIAVAAAVPGCTSYESAQNSHQAREYLTEDIEDQVVFNLIRAMNGQPFAHYDVSTVQSIVSAKVVPQVGGSRSGVSTGYQPGAVVTTAVRAITRAFSGGIGGERNNSVTVNIEPVFDQPKIYASYVHFLNLPKKEDGQLDRVEFAEAGDDGSTRKVDSQKEGNSGLEVVAETKTETVTTDKNDQFGGKVVSTKTSSEKPKPEKPVKPAPHIHFGNIHSIVGCPVKPARTAYVSGTLRRSGDLWYYVPRQYEPEFSDLCLSLVARGDSETSGAKEDATAKAVKQNTSQVLQQSTILQTR